MASSLSIRKGTTKSFVLSIEDDSRTWLDMGTLLVRLTQDALVIDKNLRIVQDDPTKAIASYTQDDTIKLTENKKFGLQLFSIVGPTATEIAAKSDIYYGIVKPSLWSEVVHND